MAIYGKSIDGSSGASSFSLSIILRIFELMYTLSLVLKLSHHYPTIINLCLSYLCIINLAHERIVGGWEDEGLYYFDSVRVFQE